LISTGYGLNREIDLSELVQPWEFFLSLRRWGMEEERKAGYGAKD
jgi:hypothetical protein